MSAAFKAQIKSTPKLVLLALADCANDQGECYPSVPTLMEKCSSGERTVQDAVSYLEREGFIRRDFRTGRSTIYWITDPSNWRTPADSAPPQQPHPTPADSAPPPPQTPHPTPANAAPITIKEPSVEPSRNQKTAPECASVPDLVAAGFDEATAAEFIAHKAKVKAPLTRRAWADHLAECRKARWTPMRAAEKVMAKNWKGFEAKYVADERPDFMSRKEAEAAKWMYPKSSAPGFDFIDMEENDATTIAIR